jgi:hypothetical protein
MTAWIGVASAEHVKLGQEGGFMQVCHGKYAPIARIKPGDCVIYYSPSTARGGGERVQGFTAAGTVRPGEAYLFDMGGGFTPYRRDIEWYDTSITPIGPLLDRLELTRGKTNWGYGFRFGVVKISDRDRDVILEAMTRSERQMAAE